MVTKTYLPSNLCDSSDSSYSSDSSDSCDRSDSSDSSDNIFVCLFSHKQKFSNKFKNSNCDETQKLKLLWNSTTQIVIRLKN